MELDSANFIKLLRGVNLARMATENNNTLVKSLSLKKGKSLALD
jgi:hypothetical protein